MAVVITIPQGITSPLIIASCRDCPCDCASCRESRQEAESHGQSMQEAIYCGR